MNLTNPSNPPNPSFIVFSDDWGEHPSSCQHIFKHIAKDYKVLWVNTIGMRNPTLSLRDAKKIALKAGKMIRRPKKEPKEYFVIKMIFGVNERYLNLGFNE